LPQFEGASILLAFSYPSGDACGAEFLSMKVPSKELGEVWRWLAESPGFSRLPIARERLFN
jgi:hypothetical protein